MTRVPYTKPPLTYAAQLQQLKDRGLIVESDAKAIHLLEKISYYRLSGYWYPMLLQPKIAHLFKPGSTFNNGFKLYCFDRELRKMVLGELEKIEVAIRSKLIYSLSHRYDVFWYTNPALFSNPIKFNKTLSKIYRELSRTDEPFISDFKKNYSDKYPPCWMTLELTSFGSLSMLYQNLKRSHDRRNIAHYFGLDDRTFESWLHSIVYVRNVCAHHSRLWSRVMSIAPRIPLNPANPWISVITAPHTISGNPPVILNKRTYFLLSMILYLLNTVNSNHTFKNKLLQLLTKYPMVDCKAMGFPDGWENEPLWKWNDVTRQENQTN
jgi:abortive infection bacteriophage resistance protein